MTTSTTPTPPKAARLFSRSTWAETRVVARRAAHRDRRRGAAPARRGRRRAGVGQLAVVGRVHGHPRRGGRPGRSLVRSSCTSGSPSGSGRPTACSRSSSWSRASSSSASSSSATCATRAGPPCRSPPRSAGWRVPALLYLAVNLGDAGRAAGWAVPTATDIAFALAVLAVLGIHLPTALRAFLLTLAVVDDLVAIVDHRDLLHRQPGSVPLLLAAAPAGRLRSRGPAAAGCCVVAAGAAGGPRPGRWCTSPGCTRPSPGVLLGLSPSRSAPHRPADEHHSVGERIEHAVPPAVRRLRRPGVRPVRRRGHVVGGDGLRDAVGDPASWASSSALVVGKALGVLARRPG